jgi:hypothetical protein
MTSVQGHRPGSTANDVRDDTDDPIAEEAMETHGTWQPLAAPFDINDNGKLDPRERRALPDSAFAFPNQRELPLVDADLTREAIAELRRVIGVTEEERRIAATNIRAAAQHFGIETHER